MSSTGTKLSYDLYKVFTEQQLIKDLKDRFNVTAIVKDPAFSKERKAELFLLSAEFQRVEIDCVPVDIMVYQDTLYVLERINYYG
jgi:hypothetical protein